MNLPPEMRTNYDNLCLIAIIHGPSSCSLRGVFEAIADELKDLESNPVIAYDDFTKRKIFTSAMLFSVTADLPGSFYHTNTNLGCS